MCTPISRCFNVGGSVAHIQRPQFNPNTGFLFVQTFKGFHWGLYLINCCKVFVRMASCNGQMSHLSVFGYTMTLFRIMHLLNDCVKEGTGKWDQFLSGKLENCCFIIKVFEINQGKKKRG